MGKAAYLAFLSFSGIPTAMAGEAAGLVTGKTYQITNPAKRVLSRTVAVVVKDNAVAVASADILSIDRFTGKVTFKPAYAVTGPITFDATYIPRTEVAGANSYSLEITGDILDDTNFKDCRANGGFHSKVYGLIDVTASIGRHSDLGKVFQNHKRNREVVLLEIYPGGDLTKGYMGWFVVETTGMTGDIGSLEDESITFNLDGDVSASFAYTGTPP